VNSIVQGGFLIPGCVVLLELEFAYGDDWLLAEDYEVAEGVAVEIFNLVRMFAEVRTATPSATS